ncbi:hypothetical protein ACQ859_19690 [Roseateles chitinivorans]|uniref:hypothetical protein n=1 Tax=Roseateles chitinivorans TaxID=2917965 RepID=UPI003D679470
MSSIRHNHSIGVVGVDPGVLSWWRALRGIAALNVCLWLAVLQFVPAGSAQAHLHLALSGVYVLVCAYRSLFPRVDLERLVVVDTPSPASSWAAPRPRSRRSASRCSWGCWSISWRRMPACRRSRRPRGRSRCSW